MILEFNYEKPTTNVNDLLYDAQLIANAFASVLEENNCLLMLTVGLHQELNNNIKDLEDLSKEVSDTNDTLDGLTTETDDLFDVLQDVVADLKNQCFSCDTMFPDLDFNMDLTDVLGNLQTNINLYNSLFNFNKLDFCQPAYALQSSCVPDILRLIVLLLTAFVAIMTLRKLSNISITAFIKGVLSTLLSKILASVKISVNIGSTNIDCLINMLKEISLALPTQANIESQLDAQAKHALGLVDNEGKSTNTDLLRSKTLDSLNTTLSNSVSNLSVIDEVPEDIKDDLNETFAIVSDVVDNSVKELNNYITSLLGFQTFFECETKRSGMDVEDAITTINRLIQVLNMLSSLALSLVKKSLRKEACKTDSTVNNLSDSQIEDLQIKDIIEDLNQTIVEIIDSSDSALEVIIHDKPTTSGLPKLDMLDCSIDSFVEAHTLPKIIEVAKKQIEEERTRTYTSSPGSSTYTFKKPSTDQQDVINNIVDLIYSKPESPKDNNITSDTPQTIVNPIGDLKGISDLLSETIRNDKSKANLSCKSVEDVLSILNTIKR